MVTYEIWTDLNPDALTAVAADTYRKWLEFALGKKPLGGKTLMHPSGRYASSISWKRTGESSIAIIADEGIAPEADWIERGRSAFSIKDKMLSSGKAKRSKDGYRYRFIPFRDNPVAPKFDINNIITSKRGERLPLRTARMWAKVRGSLGSSRGAIMSDKPGSATWIIPPMPAYSPAKILSDMLSEQYGNQRIGG